jgi:membrane protein
MSKGKRKCSWWFLIKATWTEWSDDRALRFSAALAYYAVFSLAPLLIIAVSLAGFFFGEQAARGEVVQQLSGLIGASAGAQIEALIKASADKPKSTLATAIGIVTLLIGASAVFAQLKDALNTIWGVRIQPGAAVRQFLRDYFLSFGMILTIGFLLIVSLLVTTLIKALSPVLTAVGYLPGVTPGLAELFSFILMTLLFAVIYKVLPDVHLNWKDVRVGAFVTGLLFAVGKYLIALYLAASNVGSAFGAAGALILVLTWIYYSAVIFFFGAEFTKVYSRECGGHVSPSRHATFVTKEMRVEQGVEKKNGR